MSNSDVAAYQARFIDFLVQSGALTFGSFVTKSGRKTPYFVNTGNFNTGAKIAELGSYYAAHLVSQGLADCDVIFGPAYKGIPLAVSTSIALYTDHRRSVGFSFDRKEIKDHGDKGRLVGQSLKDGDRVVLVEDVITAGTTLREVIPFLNTAAKVNVLGVVIAVDRCERGSGPKTAVQEAQEAMNVKVVPIVTVHHILEYLSPNGSSENRLKPQQQQAIQAYLEEYGV